MTNAELLNLLREAKRLIAANRLMLGHYSGVREVGSLEDRIDAAFAERQDSETDIVESEVEWDRVNAHFYTAYPDDETSLTVSRFDLTRQEWRWDMEREVKRKGYCATEAKAKSTAIAAAKGMK